MRIGHGYDAHRTTPARPLIIGGVQIDWHLGLAGHSDADVLLHAICDACLGAAGLGDLGANFGTNSPKYQNADSRQLLRETQQLIQTAGWQVHNLDATIIAQRPPLAPHLPKMRDNIAQDLATPETNINLKATTTDGLGAYGREEGMAAHAVVLLTEN